MKLALAALAALILAIATAWIAAGARY